MDRAKGAPRRVQKSLPRKQAHKKNFFDKHDFGHSCGCEMSPDLKPDEKWLTLQPDDYDIATGEVKPLSPQELHELSREYKKRNPMEKRDILTLAAIMGKEPNRKRDARKFSPETQRKLHRFTQHLRERREAKLQRRRGGKVLTRDPHSAKTLKFAETLPLEEKWLHLEPEDYEDNMKHVKRLSKSQRTKLYRMFHGPQGVKCRPQQGNTLKAILESDPGFRAGKRSVRKFSLATQRKLHKFLEYTNEVTAEAEADDKAEKDSPNGFQFAQPPEEDFKWVMPEYLEDDEDFCSDEVPELTQQQIRALTPRLMRQIQSGAANHNTLMHIFFLDKNFEPRPNKSVYFDPDKCTPVTRLKVFKYLNYLESQQNGVELEAVGLQSEAPDDDMQCYVCSNRALNNIKLDKKWLTLSPKDYDSKTGRLIGLTKTQMDTLWMDITRLCGAPGEMMGEIVELDPRIDITIPEDKNDDNLSWSLEQLEPETVRKLHNFFAFLKSVPLGADSEELSKGRQRKCKRKRPKKRSTMYNCGRPECDKKESQRGEFQVCGRCSRLRYCGAACAKADWKRHKKTDCTTTSLSTSTEHAGPTEAHTGGRNHEKAGDKQSNQQILPATKLPRRLPQSDGNDNIQSDVAKHDALDHKDGGHDAIGEQQRRNRAQSLLLPILCLCVASILVLLFVL